MASKLVSSRTRCFKSINYSLAAITKALERIFSGVHVDIFLAAFSAFCNYLSLAHLLTLLYGLVSSLKNIWLAWVELALYAFNYVVTD